MNRAVHITNVISRRGRVLSTRFQATLEGGPELAAALARLDDAVRVKAAKEALQAAGCVIAPEWRSLQHHAHVDGRHPSMHPVAAGPPPRALAVRRPA